MATSTTFIIYNTAGQPISAIQPNTLDGPQGVQQNSDLRMYGLGYPNWGEGVDENDYHIVENFACPPLSNYPLSARYILLGPTVAAITPAGQAVDELGTGNGINVPLVGQLWYNTVQNKLFVNTAAFPNPAWTTVGTQAVSIGTIPLTPTLGQLWYDQTTVPAKPQLKVYNGTSFVSVAQWYLPLTGGTLTGTLTLSSGATIAMSGAKITGLATGTLSTDAVNLGQMNSAISGSAALFLPTAGGTMTGSLNMSSGTAINMQATSAINMLGASSLGLTNGTISWTGAAAVRINAAAGRITNVGAAISTTDALTAAFADNRYVNNADSNPKTVSAPITFSNAAPPIAAAAPTIGSHLTNKTYVDAQVGSAPAQGFTQNFSASAAYSTWTFSGSAWNGTGTVGYTELPNGLIMQFGVTPPATGITEGGTTVTMLKPMTILSAGSNIIVPTSSPNTCDQSGQIFFSPGVLSSTITIYLQYNASGSSQGNLRLSWWAIGH